MSATSEIQQRKRLAVLWVAFDVDASEMTRHIADTHVAAFGLDRGLCIEGEVVRQHPTLGQMLNYLDEAGTRLKAFETVLWSDQNVDVTR